MTYEGGGQKMSEAASAQAATAGLTALVTDNISDSETTRSTNKRNATPYRRPKWRKREIFSFLVARDEARYLAIESWTRCTDTRNTAE